MNLWCAKCHTCWTEAVLNVWGPCPFKDCDGKLQPTPPPQITKKPKAPKDAPTYPLLEGTHE